MLGRATVCLAALLAAGCDDADPGPPIDVPIAVLSYNMGSFEGARALVIADHIATLAPDFVAAQECRACDQIVGALPAQYAVTDELAGVAILYDQDRWDLAAQSSVALGGNDDGWGTRYLVRARFSHPETGGEVSVYSTHWCVTIRSPDDACDEQRHLDYADTTLDVIADQTSPDSAVVLAGDFNVFDGFEDGAVISAITGDGFRDVFRDLHPTDDGTTFPGNSWAPPGRIDYIFSSPSLRARAAAIERDSVAEGTGSDHFAVSATVEAQGD